MPGDTSSFDTTLDTFDEDPTAGAIVAANHHRKVASAVTALEAKVGIAGSTVATALTNRVDRLYDIGPILVMTAYGVSTANSAASNTTATQAVIDFVAFSGGGAVLYFPKGSYDINALTISSSHITIMGAGNRITTLNYKGSTSGGSFIAIAGTEVASPSNRIEECRIFDIKLRNQGNQLTVGVKIDSANHFILERVIFSAFRKNAVRGGYFMDTEINECQFDFCGSSSDLDHAALWLGEGCNSLRFMNCRFENTTDRTVHIEKGSGSTNKIRFYGCKFESSTNDGNGIGGTDSQFWLDGVSFVTFTDCDFTYQRLQNGTHAIIPALFHIKGSSAIFLKGCYFPNGSLGAVKPFTTYIWMDGASSANTGCSFTDIIFTSGNAASPPTQTFLWSGTNNKISRKGVSWGFVSGGGTPTMDSGSPTSAADL